MIHILLNDGMEIVQGDEFYKQRWGEWREVLIFPHDKVKNVYSEKTNIPVRRLIKTHEDFEAFWREAVAFVEDMCSAITVVEDMKERREN